MILRKKIIFFLFYLLLVIVLFNQSYLFADSEDKKPTCAVKTNEKIIALTFDDGPHSRFTPQLLAVLKRNKVKATFFMIGSRIKTYPEIAKAVFEDGHVIANHTYSHPHDFEKMESYQMAKEINECNVVLESLGIKDCGLFRPPLGLVDEREKAVIESCKLKVVLWSICANSKAAATPKLMAQRVVDNVCPGSIVLLHDGKFETRWKDVAATDLIIKALRKQGYSFVTLPELLQRGVPVSERLGVKPNLIAKNYFSLKIFQRNN